MKKITNTTRLFLALCIIATGFVALSAQKHTADSLKALLPQAAPDTNKVKLLGDIAYYLYNLSPKESLEYGKQAFQLAKKLGYQRGIATSGYKISIALYAMGHYDESISEARQALKTARTLNFQLGVRSCLNIICINYRVKGMSEKALEYGWEMVKLSKEMNDTTDLAFAYNNIGTIYFDTGDDNNARKFFLEALRLFEYLGLEKNTVEALINLTPVEPDTAKKLAYIHRSIELAQRLDLPNKLSYAYTNLGHVLWKLKAQPLTPLSHSRQALNFARQTSDYYQSTLLHIDLGTLFNELGHPDSAFFYFKKGLKMAENQDMKDQMREALDQLAKLYASQNKFRQAYFTLQKKTELADSIYNQNLANALTDANARYESEKKEARLAAQQLLIAQQKNRQNRLLLSSLALFALLAATFQYFFYRQKRKKQQIELALREELAEAHRLRQLDEMKTRFFTNISHELRTPLTLIISPLQQVLEKLKQTNLQTDLQLAWQNSKKLLRMVNEVLDLAKLESDTPPTKHSDIQMVPFLRRLFLSFQSAADFKKIRLEYQMDLPDDFLLQSDPSKLEKILNNLISNALKFTPKNGLVKMTAQSGPKSLVISVSDSGPGIHPDDLPHIFDRFFQSKRRENRLPEGTGIGLAIARQYAQLLKGQLNADSEWGKGSRFTLTLPAKQPSTRPRTTATATPPPPPHPTPRQAAGVANTRWSRPRLLIVEDNADMALYLQNALSKNYDCTTAPDGEAALQLLNQSRFDLITSDVMMPNMDGFTFRQKVSQHPAWRKIPFILLTARTLESDKLRGFRLGVDDYITKPFSLPEVEARIHNLLSNKALREAFDRDYPPPPANSGADEILLKNAEKLVLNKMDDPQFSVETMAKDLGFSPRHLSRTLGRLTGLSPVKFILEMRLQRARRLMENGQFKSVTEVRYEIGIESASYFTKKFKERFGKSPKACLEERNVKM